MAPEIHSARTNSALRYNPKAADMFAFGVVMFALLMGKLPFEFGNREDRLYNLLAEGKDEEFWSVHLAELVKMES
jgi:serine/threonine protein kinase